MNQFPMNLRRYRQNHVVRDILRTVQINPSDLIQPYFIDEGLTRPEDIPALSGQKRHTLPSLMKEIEEGLSRGLRSVLLFVVPKEKKDGSFSYAFDGEVISTLKKNFGQDLLLFTDLCLCSNTRTGHCGLSKDGETIDNSSSVQCLCEKALVYAQAGADVISPSDMMDDRIVAIRKTLDENRLHRTMIMSYSTKFSSQFYGPFREAAHSAPAYGDRKSYQIDPRNENDALRSSLRDAAQGADILMVKPAGLYLDIIRRIKDHPETAHFPLCAYQVSGEYQSLHLMEKASLLKFNEAYLETLVAIKRSGADLIITYGAKDYLNLKENL